VSSCGLRSENGKLGRGGEHGEKHLSFSPSREDVDQDIWLTAADDSLNHYDWLTSAGGRHAYLVRHQVSHASSQSFPHALHFNLSLSGIFAVSDIFLFVLTPHLDIVISIPRTYDLQDHLQYSSASIWL